MSPSSSSSESNNKLQKVEAEYDVFLSFRGEDTRKGFTSHLYDSLIREGIRTFFDGDNLVRGRAISRELIEAIQGSRGSVVVLSENYAFSTWCLAELCKIVECMETSRYIVLPIFYRVDPSHVRKLSGSYSDAFKQHESNPMLKTQVETWKDALIKVGNLSGWTLEETDVEAKFIKDIIADLSRQLDIKKESAHERERRIRLQDVVYCDRDLMSKMVNPANAPSVVGKLLDGECPEEFIKCYILTLRSLFPVAQLVKECDKRNRLGLLTEFLEQLEHEGNQDVQVHNALGKIKIDRNNNPERFLTTNQYYDSHVLGEYCEKRKHPSLAVVAYCRGQCDKELINVTNTNSMFEQQARYVVERMDGELWKNVLDNGNEYRSKLIDEVISNVLPESKSFGQVSAAIEAWSHASIPHKLIELLEKIVLQISVFSGNSDLQCLLIQNAIKEDPTRVMNYINKLDNFDGPKFGLLTQEAQLYEEAFAIYKKFNLNVEAVIVLMDKLQRIDRAVEFAYRVKEDAVWNQVRKAQHDAVTANVYNYHYLKLVAKHDVFVSFSGRDTRNGFTGYLYDAFMREGLRIFSDVDNLESGMDLSSELMKAIQGSRSSVIILSENYASSRWCLRELYKIVECMDTSGLIVLPVFYHVNPSDARRLTGSYGDAFRKHENNDQLNSKEVETWRDALNSVGAIHGWYIDQRVVEAKIVKEIAAALSSQLDIGKESPHETTRC